MYALMSQKTLWMCHQCIRVSRNSRNSLWSCSKRNNTSDARAKDISVDGKTYKTDSWTNVSSSILSAVPRRLHQQDNHPISITRKLIESRFPNYQHHNDFFPVVTVGQNFDSLGFPQDHPGRSRTDTYYVNKDQVLRTHTSAHQADVFRANTHSGFTISADVYRRDAIDRSHYPIFHQMEGAMTWDRDAVPEGKTLAQQIWDDVEKLPKHNLVVEDPNPTTHAERNPLQSAHSPEEAEAMAAHLKRSLENVVVEIFSKAKDAAAAGSDGAPVEEQASLQVRWIEAYFPFTSPSWELEIFWLGEWLEVLGCGIVQQPLLDNADVPSRIGWAFGIGLERIAMLLYEIPDIRLFWSQDPRFLSQFNQKEMRRYVPFSKYPAAPRDVAFWLPKAEKEDDKAAVTATPAGTSTTPSPAGGLATETEVPAIVAFHENDIMEIVRNTAGDLVEDVTLVDEFTHPKTGRRSLCYRINYRSLERTLSREETNDLHEKIRAELVDKFGVQLR